jgi:hypothetical protein
VNALDGEMYKWAFDIESDREASGHVRRVSIELRVDDALMARVIYPSLEAYIDASRAALIADVHAYQAEVTAAEAAHRKRRRDRKRQRKELKADRAEAHLGAAAPAYHDVPQTRTYIVGVRAQLLYERVAPGGDVLGVEVLEGKLIGPKARASAQVDARHQSVGRIVLACDVLDQARAPAHGVRAPLVHG